MAGADDGVGWHKSFEILAEVAVSGCHLDDAGEHGPWGFGEDLVLLDIEARPDVR